MTVSQFKAVLPALRELTFILENGAKLASGFQVCELGVLERKWIATNGAICSEKVMNIQLRKTLEPIAVLEPNALLQMVQTIESKLELSDLDVQLEFLGEPFGRYDLWYDGFSLSFFLLNPELASGSNQEGSDLHDKKKKYWVDLNGCFLNSKPGSRKIH